MSAKGPGRVKTRVGGASAEPTALDYILEPVTRSFAGAGREQKAGQRPVAPRPLTGGGAVAILRDDIGGA